MTTYTGSSFDDNIKGGSGADILNGGAGDDFLMGKAGADIIDGGQGNDQIQGNEGDDQIRGGQGNDFIHGGIGTDTAYYSGSIFEYSFSRDGENLYVNHTGGSGIDGNDHLLHIERLQFSNVIIDLTQNNAPIAQADSASTNEDVGTYSSGSTSVLSNDFDWEGDSLTATPGTFNGTYGTLVLNSDGTYTYTPNALAQTLAQGQVVQDTFTYTVSDGSLSGTGTLTINLSGVNDAPVANPDTAMTGENSIVTVNVLANDTDVDNGAVLTVTAASAPAGQGSASVVGNQVQWDPGTDFDYLDTGETANVVVNYTIQDQFGATSSSTVTITVNGANDAPVANDDTASTSEDAAVSGNVLANDTDVDGETLTVTNPGTYVGAYGTLTLAADGSYSYTPNAAAQGLDDGETGGDTFSYTASDGTASDTATLSVTVNGANDAPVANDDTASTDEETAVSGNVLTNDTDADVEPLAVAAPGTYVGSYGTLTIAADGSYTYTPDAAAQALDTGETAQDVFTYSATDGTASGSATLTVTVTGLNDAPVANDDTNVTDENSAVSGNVLANDTDVDVETLTVANPGTYIGAYGTLVLAANGSYTYTPGAAAALLNTGQSANDIFNYIASDGTATDNATLTITVNGLSGAPNAVDDTATTNEDNAVSGNVLANDTDAENDPLTVSNPGTYSGTYGTLTLAADGSYTYTPNAAANGLAAGQVVQDVFSYTATDGSASDTASLTVTVNGTNDAPTIDAGGTDASGSVAEEPDDSAGEDVTVHTDSGTIAFDDVDVIDTHSASFTPQGGGYYGTFTLAAVNQGTDSVGWNFSVPDSQLEGLSEGQIVIQTYTVEIDDGNGGTVTQDVTITITGAGVGVGPQTVWFIDNSDLTSANLGTSADPYTSIAAFNAAQGTLGGPQAGHTVHLRAGSGTGIYAEADGINLLNGQILVGDANGSVRPTIVTTAGDGINVAQNNNVSGIDIGDTSGADISDSGGTVGNLVITDVGTSGTGRIIDVDQGGTLNVTLNSAESLGSTGGAIDLNLVGGSFTVSGATNITGVHTGGGVDITASSVNASLAGGGTISTGTTTAVNYVGNTGSLTLGGGLDIVTTSGTGLNATGGGTVEATGAGNSIVSGTGTALNIVNTTIGAADLTFESISAGAGSNVGINLDTTGSLGGLHVTGTGVAGSGGVIAGKTGADGSTTSGIGINLNNTADVQLNWMQLNDHSNFAIRGNQVDGFIFDDSVISGVNGTAAGAFNEGAISFTNLVGSGSISNSSIGGGFEYVLKILNSSGSLNRLTIDNTTFGSNDTALGGDAVQIVATNSATVNTTVVNSTFTGAREDLFSATAQGAANMDVVFRDNDLSNNHANRVSAASHILVFSTSTGSVGYDISHNDLTTGATGAAIAVAKGVPDSGTGGTMAGTVNANNIGLTGVAGSGSDFTGIFASSLGSGTHTTAITNNVILHYNEEGILLKASDPATGGDSVLNATITGNTIDEPDAFAFAGIWVQAGSFTPGETNTINVVIGDANDVSLQNNLENGDPNAFSDVFFDQSGGAVINLSLAGSTSGTATEVVQDDNVGTPEVFESGTVNLVASLPPTPPPVAPLMAGFALVDDDWTGSRLGQAELDLIVDAAIQRWADSGISEDQLAAMRAATVDVVGLRGDELGISRPGMILIDNDAAGHGWFVDPTPGDDGELMGDRIDLLTVVMHELGHQIGLDDHHLHIDSDELMFGALNPGERRLPGSMFEETGFAGFSDQGEWGLALLPDGPDMQSLRFEIPINNLDIPGA